jgi:hypothetical protein
MFTPSHAIYPLSTISLATSFPSRHVKAPFEAHEAPLHAHAHAFSPRGQIPTRSEHTPTVHISRNFRLKFSSEQAISHAFTHFTSSGYVVAYSLCNNKVSAVKHSGLLATINSPHIIKYGLYIFETLRYLSLENVPSCCDTRSLYDCYKGLNVIKGLEFQSPIDPGVLGFLLYETLEADPTPRSKQEMISLYQGVLNPLEDFILEDCTGGYRNPSKLFVESPTPESLSRLKYFLFVCGTVSHAFICLLAVSLKNADSLTEVQPNQVVPLLTEEFHNLIYVPRSSPCFLGYYIPSVLKNIPDLKLTPIVPKSHPDEAKGPVKIPEGIVRPLLENEKLYEPSEFAFPLLIKDVEFIDPEMSSETASVKANSMSTPSSAFALMNLDEAPVTQKDSSGPEDPKKGKNTPFPFDAQKVNIWKFIDYNVPEYIQMELTRLSMLTPVMPNATAKYTPDPLFPINVCQTCSKNLPADPIKAQEHSTTCRVQKTPYLRCEYCLMEKCHLSSFCPILHHICRLCNFRGHVEGQCPIGTNKIIQFRDYFESHANQGYYTNFREIDPAYGFYRLPILFEALPIRPFDYEALLAEDPLDVQRKIFNYDLSEVFKRCSDAMERRHALVKELEEADKQNEIWKRKRLELKREMNRLNKIAPPSDSEASQQSTSGTGPGTVNAVPPLITRASRNNQVSGFHSSGGPAGRIERSRGRGRGLRFPPRGYQRRNPY